MVEAYSRKNFTHRTDLLPALGGIANRVHDCGRYLAGTWEANLAHHLAWYSTVEPLPDALDAPPVVPRREDANTAPTFLWASAGGPVRFLAVDNPRAGVFYQEFIVEGVVCIPSGQNPLCEVKGGRIQLTGIAIPALIVNEFERPMDANVFMKQERPNERCLWATLNCPGLGHFIFHPDRAIPQSLIDEPYICFLLFSSAKTEHCFALVLAKNSRLKDSRLSRLTTYFRIGMIGSMNKSDFRGFPKVTVSIE